MSFILFEWIIMIPYNYDVKPVALEPLSIKRGQENDPFYQTKQDIKPIRIDKSKKSIIIMGCSFAYGLALFDDEILSYKLMEKTHRQTYNYAFPMEGIQHVLYKIQNDEDFNKNVKNADYVIYLFITDHLRRMYCNFFSLTDKNKYLKYRKTKDGLKQENPEVTLFDYIKGTKFAIKLNSFIYNNLISDNKKFDLLKLYLEECKKSLENKNPNCKMVIVIYNSEENSKQVGIKPFHTNRWKELEEEGFIVINFDTEEYNYLNTKEYIAEDKLHPSAKVWEKLTPIIAKKLNLL